MDGRSVDSFGTKDRSGFSGRGDDADFVAFFSEDWDEFGDQDGFTRASVTSKDERGVVGEGVDDAVEGVSLVWGQFHVD